MSPSIPKFPLIGDPLRRIDVPEDLEAVTTRGEEADPAEAGMTAEAVERIWHDAVSWYKSGVHPAIQLCVRRNGIVVLDRTIGHARGNGPRDDRDAKKVLATNDTPFCVYSASKAITAFVVHMLDERGAVHIGDPIAEYIPGYSRHGKGGITVGHVLSHKAGVPNLPREAMAPETIGDDGKLLEILSDAKPRSRPGKNLAYHAVSGGFLLAAVVKAATGKTIREVLADEILDPLGFRWTNYGVAPGEIDKVAVDAVTGPPVPPPLSTFLTRALGQPVDRVVEAARTTEFLTAIIPAANIISTANEMSRFYEIMRRGGELDGVRVLHPRTLRRALMEQSHLEIDASLGFPTRFSYGLMLGSQHISLFGPDSQEAFGHLGFTNMLTWADPERALAVAFQTNGKPVVYPEITRFLGLPARIGREAPKITAAGDRYF